MNNDELKILLVDINELSRQLSIPVGTLRNMTWRRELPYIKLKRTVRFDPDEIRRWLDEKKVEPFDERKSSHLENLK
ncbi:MAG: helix-turn-helix domain-containing protein [Proteobacteria bacterium]|nr:helix-turn-helix domain-containing protein [Pseudomonadota bacterium]